MNTHRRISLLACTLGLLAAAMPASAQSTYPDHPVKLLVALPAGGGVDIIARLVGQKLAASTGQPFVVDNRAALHLLAHVGLLGNLRSSDFLRTGRSLGSSRLRSRSFLGSRFRSFLLLAAFSGRSCFGSSIGSGCCHHWRCRRPYGDFCQL